MKRILAWLVIILLILGYVLPFVQKEKSVGALYDEAIFRTMGEIDSDEYIYIDDEAIALSCASDIDTSLRSEALKTYNYINEERENAGLDSLIWDQNLESTSTVRAQECSVSFSHTRPNGKAWYTVNSGIQGGENLAYGYSDGESATEAWMNSQTHRDNILYPDFEKVAISIYQTDEGITYWASEFGY